MSDLSGRVVWWCGRVMRGYLEDWSTGKAGVLGDFCVHPSSPNEVRHLRSKYGCGWYELTAMKEGNDE